MSINAPTSTTEGAEPIQSNGTGKGIQLRDYDPADPANKEAREKGAKQVAEKLKEREKDIGEKTKPEMEKLIAEIRKNPETTRKNAIILHTYAVQHMGVTADQLGGIEQDWNGKTWAILRKCQAEGVGGKSINVKQDDLDNIDWSKTKPKNKDTVPTDATAVARDTVGADKKAVGTGGANNSTDSTITAAKVTTGTVADTIASNADATDNTEITRKLAEQLGQTQFEFNGEVAPMRVDASKVQIIAVDGKPGIYEIQSPDLGNVTKDKIYVSKDGKMVTAEGKTEDVKINVSMPTSLIGFGSLIGNEQAKRLKEFIAKANVKDGEYTVSQSEGKVSLKLSEPASATA